MNAKEAKLLRREARAIWSKREGRMHRDAYLARSYQKAFPTGKTDEHGNPQSLRLTVHTVTNHPDSLRGIYRGLKALVRGK